MKTYMQLIKGFFCVCIAIMIGFACTSEKGEQKSDAKTPEIEQSNKVIFEPEAYYNMPLDEVNKRLGFSGADLRYYKDFKSIFFGCNENGLVAQISFVFLKADIPLTQMTKLGYGDVTYRSFEGNPRVVRRWTNVNSKVRTISVRMESNGHETKEIIVTFRNAP
ncbi:MAG: hypothetical protein KAX39_08245 [candidate division Zixibacteria bacterium]|nr:hypothetical protein [candidate division Zixibacteria bacterium]